MPLLWCKQSHCGVSMHSKRGWSLYWSGGSQNSCAHTICCCKIVPGCISESIHQVFSAISQIDQEPPWWIQGHPAAVWPWHQLPQNGRKHKYLHHLPWNEQKEIHKATWITWQQGCSICSRFTRNTLHGSKCLAMALQHFHGKLHTVLPHTQQKPFSFGKCS